MRKTFWIFIVVVVMVAWFWHSKYHCGAVAVAPPSNTTLSANTPTAKPQTSGQTGPSILTAIGASSNSPPLIIYSSQLRNPDVFQNHVNAENRPIDFYGLVIDQDSNALANVDVKIAVRHVTVADLASFEVSSTEIRLEQLTGTDGRFEIHGATGDGFDLESIEKDGYEAEPGQRSFGSTAGSIEQPVFFKMWSTNVHEKLIGGEKAFHIVPDGRAYFINLTDGTIAESGNGDLKVWVQYTNAVTRGQIYAWSAGIEVQNGGLFEEPLGSAMYEAPSGGYVPEFHLQQHIKGSQRGQTGDRQFYLLLGNGQEYGQMAIDLYAPFNNGIPGLVRISYAINPSGSRILY
jgi:hypothetical protein